MKINWRNNLLVLTLLVGFSGFTHAIPMLHQSNDGIIGRGSAFIGGAFTIDRAQTFTVGLTGIMTAFDVRVQREDYTVEDLLWDIRTVTAGDPTEPNAGANILASGSVAAASLSGTNLDYLSIAGLNLAVSLGDVLAIALRSDDPTSGAYHWNSDYQADGYAGGAGHIRFLDNA